MEKYMPEKPLCQKKLDHGGQVEAQVEFVAGHAGLRDFEDSGANAIGSADLDFLLEQTFGG